MKLEQSDPGCGWSLQVRWITDVRHFLRRSGIIGIAGQMQNHVLVCLVLVINQNTKQQLALCWHSIHTQLFIQGVSQMMKTHRTVLPSASAVTSGRNRYISLWKQVPCKLCCITNDRHCKFTLHTCCKKAQETINPQMIISLQEYELSANALQVKHTAASPLLYIHLEIVCSKRSHILQ